METKDWQAEQERLDRVTQKLRQRIVQLEPKIADLREQVTDFRRHFWEEVTVNTGSDEDFEDTVHSINQQTAVLSERERGHRLLTQRWKGMQRLLPSPYFGRIDFRELGSTFTDPVYIGVSSFIDDDGFTFLVYDWRTPIASMYYDHSPGDAFYVAPSGRVEGRMELKRQYQIQDGRIRSMFDTSLTIGDELLQQVLGHGANPHMKSIVATIQREQNAIIREDSCRMLIVQGAAGSGKTSAALQRVAYLLYKHRETLAANQVILFSPNPIFNSYVSTVLPELGEENMEQTTFQDYLEHSLGRSFRVEDPFDQIEYELAARSAPGYKARLQAMRYKASDAFLQALNHYALWLGREGMMFKGIRFRGRSLITAKQMKAQFYSYPASLTLANRVALLRTWLLDQLAVLERKEVEAEWVGKDLDYLDNDQYAEVFGELHKDREVLDIAERYASIIDALSHKRRGDEADFNFSQREEEALRRRVVKEAFKPLRRKVKRLRFVDMKGLYAQLFRGESAYHDMTGASETPPLWADICAQTQEKLSQSELFYEDATPYLYLKELIEGVRTNRQIRYVFVDEGQDYSPFQYEYLKKLFPGARMTVLGDFRQAIFTQTTNLQTSDSPLLQLYGPDDTRVFRLVRSYRSTREIVNFTKGLLADTDDIVPFERSGKKPQLVHVQGGEQRALRLAEDIASLRAEGFDAIAVITKTRAESEIAYAALAAQGCEHLMLVTKRTVTFAKGVTVIPVYLAKGVEFDAVLIYDASSGTYGEESERKLLYTACTRAMHRLLLYAVSAWSPFLQGLDPDVYEMA